jgi:thiamine biosynthesis lipoprotein
MRNHPFPEFGSCILCLCLMLIAGAQATAQMPLQRYELSVPTMGTRMDVVLYAESRAVATHAIDGGLDEINRLAKILSNYDPDSEISQISRNAYSQPIAVSRDLGHVLEHAVRWHTLSRGRFDITVGPLTQLWRSARQRKQLPSETDILAAKKKCGWQHLKLITKASEPDSSLSVTSVQLLVPDMVLDVSGLATGYILDRAFDAIQARGIRRLLINVGGDIRAGEPPPGKEGWNVSVAGLGAGSEPLMNVRIANHAVTSSGDLYQFVELDGRRYSHFIDPIHGGPIERRQCVTAFAKTTLDADAGATAMAVLGVDASIELWDAMPITQAIFVVAAGDHGPKMRVITNENAEFAPFGKQP